MTAPSSEAQLRIRNPAEVKRIRLSENSIRNLKQIQEAELKRTGRRISPSVAIEIALHLYVR